MKKTAQQTINSKAEAIKAMQTATAQQKQTKAQKQTAKQTDSKAEAKKQTEKVVINYDSVSKALASIDSRFVVYDDSKTNEKAFEKYCSVRCILKDSTIDKRIVFSLYYNTASVCIHCAKRFDSVCSNAEYHLNKKKTEYTKSVSLDDLKTHVDALIKHEIERLKMTATATATEAKQTAKNAK